jgi:hypothetical protein
MKAWMFNTKDDPSGSIEQDPAELPDLPVQAAWS